MGKYTILDNGELDERIDKDIVLCREHILKVFGNNLLSLVLIGGYGRGEGGVTSYGEALGPKNNYDFLIILRKVHFWNKRKIKISLEKLKSELDKRLLVPFEYSFQSERKIQRAPCIMIYQDIYNVSMTIHGQDIKELLSSEITKPLDHTEALRIIRNRSVLLLLSGVRADHRSYKATPQQIKIWISKAIIGFGDAILILKNAYETRYVEKMTAIEQLDFQEVFKNETDYNYFKTLYRTVSLYRIKDEDSTLLEDRNRMINVLEQINLWVIRQYLNDQEFGWENFSRISIYLNEPSKIILRNVLINLIEHGFLYFFKQLFSNPKNILTHPADKLFKVLSLVLYKPDFDFLKICRTELNLNIKATLIDIQKESFRIYDKYIM